MVFDPEHRIGQLPVHKGGAVTQSSGLALQQRNIVPRLKIADIAGEVAFVLGDYISPGNHYNVTGIDPQRDTLPCKTGRNIVAVAVVLNQAGGSHTHGLLNIAIKGTAQGAQISLLPRKNSINRVILMLRVPTTAKHITLQMQPGIQAFHILKSQFGREQLAAQKLHLVLDLPLLPACCRGARHRLHHVVVHQRQKRRMEYPVF